MTDEIDRQAAFAEGFSAALQGAEAAIWRIEDDSFLYENVSKALQEVISELQAMEQNWTGRVTIEHRQAAIKERDAQIVAWLLNVYDTGSVDGLICRSDGAEDLLRMLGEVR